MLHYHTACFPLGKTATGIAMTLHKEGEAENLIRVGI